MEGSDIYFVNCRYEQRLERFVGSVVLFIEVGCDIVMPAICGPMVSTGMMGAGLGFAGGGGMKAMANCVL
jgi:hypothetical protein